MAIVTRCVFSPSPLRKKIRWLPRLAHSWKKWENPLTDQSYGGGHFITTSSIYRIILNFEFVVETFAQQLQVSILVNFTEGLDMTIMITLVAESVSSFAS